MKPIILHGHERAITYLKYSPDGDVFFSAAKDSTPTMWRAKSGERIGIYEGHTGAVFQLDVTDDTKYLLSASMDSTCHIWEVNTGKIVNVLDVKTPIRSLAVSEGNKFLCLSTLSFAGVPPSIFIYDISQIIAGSTDPVLVIQNACPAQCNITSFVWKPLNVSIIAGCTDGEIRVFNATDGKQEMTIKAHESDISSLVASYDRTMFATASKDAKAKLYDMQTMEEILCFSTDRPLNSVALSPILNQLVVVGGVEARDVTTTRSQKMESIFFSLSTQEEIGRVKGSFGTMNCVQYNPDGKSFITGGEDGYVRLCFFDKSYFTKDEEMKKKLMDINEMAKEAK